VESRRRVWALGFRVGKGEAWGMHGAGCRVKMGINPEINFLLLQLAPINCHHKLLILQAVTPFDVRRYV
jgi:hypothetical protein